MHDASHSNGLAERQRLLIALRKMEARLEAAERDRREPIAVVGMSCRFPGGASTLDLYWNLLESGRCAVRKVPDSRWDADALYDPDPLAPGKIGSRYGSFLDEIDLFDASFFGISAREAACMDPQQRLLLEVIWGALENAAIPPDCLAGSRTAVYTGICFNDYGRRHFFSNDRSRIDPWSGTGIAGSVASGRISYVLGLRGPNLPVDTACSSSLVAVHLACQSLRAREADAAIAAGVNLMLSPEPSIYLTKVGALARDGISKVFDAAADGYGRSEGCAAIVLKRLSDALAAGDAVMAVIPGSAVNHDGRSAGLTVPSGLAQMEVLRSALAAAQLDAGKVDYVEAHGTGTPLGDPIEIQALHAALAAQPGRRHKLIAGSVKTNIGHLEAAAGLAGLIKVVLAIQHGEIPAHLHLNRLNPEIEAYANAIEFPIALTSWPVTDKPKLAGVSAFGFSGTNAHVLIEEAPAAPASPANPVPGLLVISAKSAAALEVLRGHYCEMLRAAPARDWPAICVTAALGRNHFAYRTAIIATSCHEALSQLEKEGTPVPVTGETHKIAARYMSGETLNLEEIFSRRATIPNALPNYPFERQRYWLDAPVTCEVATVPSLDHPLLGKRLRSPLRETQYESQISLPLFPWLAGHRVHGELVFPASAYIGMALMAARESGDANGIRQLSILEPLTPAEPRTVQLIASDGRFRILSRASGPDQDPDPDPEHWITHCEGVFETTDNENTPRPSVDLASIRKCCREEIGSAAFYLDLRARGLHYGEAFQRIDRIWRGSREVLARLSPIKTLDSLAIHPAVLDGGFQALYAAIEDINACYIPASFGRIQNFAEARGPVWCHAILRDGGADLHFCDDDGVSLLEVTDAVFHPVDANWRQVVPSTTHDFYQAKWIEQPLQETSRTACRWLVFGSLNAEIPAFIRELRRAGSMARVDKGSEDLLVEVASSGEPWGCVYVGSTGSTPALETVSGREMLVRQQGLAEGLIVLTQRLLASLPGPNWRGLWLITRGAQRVADDEPSGDIEAATLWALRRGIATEGRELRARAVDLDGLESSYRTLERELSHAAIEQPEDQIAIRNGRRFVLRLVKAQIPGAGPVRLENNRPGQLDSLSITAARRRTPGAGQVEIQVHAAGVNFRDVMGALGMYPGNPGPLGAECAGEIHAIGAGTISAQKGDRVMALAAGSLASFAIASEKLVWPLPEAMSFEDAATIPVAFLTAYYALFHVAGLAAGERVLIHSATGGVGMAALQLALQHGAEIIATAGSAERRTLLKSMGASLVFDSRTPDFAAEILAVTPGVDMVLNSLAGASIDAGLNTLRRNGRFVEIGKAETREPAEIMARWPGIRYARFDLGELAVAEPDLVHDILAHILGELTAERLKPLPSHVYPLAQARDAFHLMAQRKHIGKLVLRPETRAADFDAGATHLITGGLGAIGCELARWLVDRGARNLVLIGRSLPCPAASTLIAELRTQGAHIEVWRADVSDAQELEAVFAETARTMPPIQTVIHAAGTLGDGELAGISWANCEEVATAKIAGAWNLLRSSMPRGVERIILFSSISSLFAPPGQAAYAMANEFLDALSQSCWPRVLAIDWGPWREIGMAARGGSGKAERYGIEPFSAREALNHFEALLSSSLEGRIVAMHANPARFQRAFALLGRPRWLEQLGASECEINAGPTLMEELAILPAEDGRVRLREYLVSVAVRTLDLPGTAIDPDRPLQEMGLDSMMAVELRNEVQQALGVDIAATTLFDYPTIHRLAAHLEKKAHLWNEEAYLNTMSDEQVADLLAHELSTLGRLDSK